MLWNGLIFLRFIIHNFPDSSVQVQASSVSPHFFFFLLSVTIRFHAGCTVSQPMFSLKYLHSIVTQNRLQHIINIFLLYDKFSVEIQILICYTNHVLDCGVRTIHDGMLILYRS